MLGEVVQLYEEEELLEKYNILALLVYLDCLFK